MTGDTLLAFGFLLAGAPCSLLAAALIGYSPHKLQKMLKNGRRVRAEDLLQHEVDYQLLCRSLTLACLVAAILFLRASDPPTVVWVLAAVTALILYGVLPAALAEHRAEALVDRGAWALRLLRKLLHYPLLSPLRMVARGVLRLLRVPRHPRQDREEIADEIMAAVADSVTENALDEEEKEWIGNIVELSDLRVSEAMTPRTDMVALDRTISLDEAITTCLRTGHSRYPVYEQNMDNVVGVFYAKDALLRGRTRADGKTVEGTTAVGEIMRKPLFVPETMGVVELLSQFKATKLQLAVVLDEYGGTAGLISIEDIIEEIVGDISDEYDAEEVEDPVRIVEEGRVLEISARERVEEVNDLLGTELPEDGDYDTIAGLVCSHLGRIPAVGESFHLAGVEVKVLVADERRISRLRIAALEPRELESP